LWITFWREFSGVFLGDFLRATGPGASARGLFSADGVLLVRWASADLGPFSTFFAFLVRFLPVFVPFFALFPSMPCAYLYVHNFPRTRVSRFGRKNLASDKETAETARDPSIPARRDSLRAGSGTKGRINAECRTRNAERGMRNGKGEGIDTFSRPACRSAAETRRSPGAPGAKAGRAACRRFGRGKSRI